MNAYRKLIDVYDDILTANGLWSKIYNRLAWGMREEAYVPALLSMIPDDFKGKMLDIPVGTGVLTAEKYRRLKNADITAVDFSPDMLALAKKRFSDLDNVACLQGDAASLPFKTESFDLVLSMNGFHAFSDKNMAFKETARVLKKGGIFCGCFYIRGQRKITDFIVNQFLAPKGWFVLPFFKKDEVMRKLGEFYSMIHVFNVKAIICFKCIK